MLKKVNLLAQKHSKRQELLNEDRMDLASLNNLSKMCKRICLILISILHHFHYNVAFD